MPVSTTEPFVLTCKAGNSCGLAGEIRAMFNRTHLGDDGLTTDDLQSAPASSASITIDPSRTDWFL
jgi:hypothetical protein